MGTERRGTSDKTGKEDTRVAQAKKSLRGMQDEIAPFLRRRRIVTYSTAGSWREGPRLGVRSKDEAE